MEVSMSCSCSKQIAAGEHLRRGEILLLFGFTPCECATSPEAMQRRRELHDGAAIAKSLALLACDLQDDVVEWGQTGQGYGLIVAQGGIGSVMRDVPMWLSGAGFSVQAGGGCIVFGARKIWVRSTTHATNTILGMSLTRAWVHAGAPERWRNNVQSTLVRKNGVLVEWA